MPALIERDCTEQFHWHPYVSIEKYSTDQARWAQQRLDAAIGWRRLPVLNRVPLGEGKASRRKHKAVGWVHDLHGDWMRELFPEGPEDGYAYDDGNLLVNTGLTVIIKLLFSAGSTSYYPLINANTAVGVGTTATAATTADTALGSDNTSNAYYMQSDTSYPTLTTPATINNQATFGTLVANFAWNEWCWATGAGTVTAGDKLGTGGSSASNIFATASSTNLINHKVPISSLGTKASGASWVFSTTVVFS
jgi:hypothetical protein